MFDIYSEESVFSQYYIRVIIFFYSTFTLVISDISMKNKLFLNNVTVQPWK